MTNSALVNSINEEIERCVSQLSDAAANIGRLADTARKDYPGIRPLLVYEAGGVATGLNRLMRKVEDLALDQEEWK